VTSYTLPLIISQQLAAELWVATCAAVYAVMPTVVVAEDVDVVLV